MKTLKSFLLIITGILAVAFRGHSAEINPADSVLPVYRCKDFKVTGDGSNQSWNAVSWTSLKQRGSKVSYSTQFKIMYSDSGIYCLYTCEDALITATMKEDFMDIYKEDVVEVFFWTDETVPVYFEYELSPLNVELPIMVPNYNGRFFGWRPWHYEGNRRTRHAVSIQTDPGSHQVVSWMAEFYIPYTLLKPIIEAPPRQGTTWRANFYRIDYDKGSTGWSWMPVRTNFHDYEKFGTLLFQ
jgi:hypothetical protein